MASCLTCGVDWSSGSFTVDCDECGGGAMTRPCMICGGRCGAILQRLVSDSHDSGLGHWAGDCKLPKADRQAAIDDIRKRGR